MSKQGNNRIFIIGGSALVIGAVVFVVWYVKRRKTQDTREEGDGLFATVSSSGSSTASSSIHHRPGSTKPFRCTSRSYPLEFGTCHPDVMVLQRYLKRLKTDLGSSGPNRDGVDGKFGSKTQQAALSKLRRDSFSQTDIKGMKQTLNS